MQPFALAWGMISLFLMVVGFLPCFGALNWLNIPFSGLGLCVSIFALATETRTDNNGGAIAGMVGCSVALIFGLFRLVLGGGVF